VQQLRHHFGIEGIPRAAATLVAKIQERVT
jgi:hypothetical protein